MVKVLVPVDGSENALRAAEYAAEWMEVNPEVETTLLHVTHISSLMKVPLRSGEGGLSRKEYDDLLKEEARVHLGKAVEIFEKRGLKVETELIDTMDDPANEIIAAAKEGGFDYLVMGRRGMGTCYAIVLGGISQKILHLIDIPVILIK